jgi:hypothetical protein
VAVTTVPTCTAPVPAAPKRRDNSRPVARGFRLARLIRRTAKHAR